MGGSRGKPVQCKEEDPVPEGIEARRAHEKWAVNMQLLTRGGLVGKGREER